MIIRIWTARSTAANAIKYREHFETHVLPALRVLKGYLQAELLSRASSEGVEIVVTTRWESLEAIRAFAGDDLEKAVVADEAKLLFTDWDRRVQHYEVLVQDTGSQA